MQNSREPFLWVEKYRPKTLSECIFPKRLEETFQGILDSGRIPNLLLCGPPGVGKTTIALALCEELNADPLKINASEQGGIDTLRTTVKQFASTVSVFGGNSRKVIIFDEADYLSYATQPALRAFIEEFHENCTFILTCNYKNKIIEPLHSRCNTIDFTITKEEKKLMIEKLYNRCKDILDKENVKYDTKALAHIVVKYYPDFRKTIGELQNFVRANGEINTEILKHIPDINLKPLMDYLKSKKYNDVNKWLVQNLDVEPISLFRKIYDDSKEFVTPNSIPVLVDHIAEYQDKLIRGGDPEIIFMAFFARLMMDCDYVG